MPGLSRIPGKDNLYVGGVFVFSERGPRKSLYEAKITHVLSVIKFSFDDWGEKADAFKHMSIDIDDDEDADLLEHFPDAVRFIDGCLYPGNSTAASQEVSSSPTGEADAQPQTDAGASEETTSPGAVYVHCAMGRSRSVSCVIAYLLYKYPHRFGARQPSTTTTAQRRAEAGNVVANALKLVQVARSIAEPNEGFMRQLELWWEMGCPVEEGALENHPVYQRWLYERMLKEARDAKLAPDARDIRFEDEAGDGSYGDEPQVAEAGQIPGKEVRCKKCRRVLATSRFRVPHAPTGQAESPNCAHIFTETLSWMRPALEDGALEGRLNCPNAKCGANVGRFAWQGLRCSCREWIVPAFSLARSRVDEVFPRSSGPGGLGSAVRLPPGRNGSL